ncbi:polysaccharide deacetylase [Rhizobium sp. Leaf384]|uniref:polysaccharide deacetylase family protein n=1 Tax=unclassified Rhizobium TaxID=2613769 RepID=UPI0007144A2E|nr:MULTISPECIES: polysaccharide deacetylase family protein [unclassified Rhizobium]KQR69280.1 polysaccharide deacetylase [Rhizobium sp. Leaf341]KQS77055.1 polysaccharide deacetylase [Rhizobium sp. Leaf384]KQS78326.1 polysaccharide deacetylase [Rhizobium sp. Leaf383]
MKAGGDTDIIAALDRFRDAGRVARFWLRDDDAIEPTAGLDRLLDLTETHGVPLALAVIPEPTGPALARRLARAPFASVTVHGWRHANHATAAAKKCELGADRPADIVLGELAAGLAKLSDLYGDRCLPVLVPPWNRVDPGLLPGLPDLGFRALSVYGPEKRSPLPMVNTHVDVMDWHGTRGCRDAQALRREIVARLGVCLAGGGSVGLLTHHLVHDEAVWTFLGELFVATTGHPACQWVGLSALVDLAAADFTTADQNR